MRTLTILQINDLHGYLEPHPELFDLTRPDDFRSGGGLGRVAAIFRHVRSNADGAVLALDNGDTFHGTMPAVRTRGEALVGPMRALELDAMTAHWEFVYGLRRVCEIAGALPYPVLASNCRDAEGRHPFPPCVLVERGGLRVGVIGLAAVVAQALLPDVERGLLDWTMGEAELPLCVAALRREHAADLIVVLSHLGFPQDCKLAAKVPGIDVLLSGHTHNRLEAPVTIGSTLIMQSGAHGSFVGRLDLTVAGDGIAGWTHALTPVDSTVEPDAGLTALTGAALAPFAQAQARVVAETDVALHRYSMFESTMDNLLLDATAAAAGTQVALSNGWRYGAPIPPGPLTELDLWAIVPADPPVSIVELSGREIRQLFEDNLEATFACDPWQQRGGYVKRFRGLELVVKLENPAGHRIQEMTADGARIDEDQKLAVAFLGDQAVPPGIGRHRRDAGPRAVEALSRHVQDRRRVAPTCQGRLRVV